jgi:type I restriction enzyme S subunit
LTSLWQEVVIGDVAEVFDGPHATPKTVEVGPIFLGIKSLNNGRLDLTETRHVTEEDFSKWTKRVTPREGDVVFSYETRIGDAAVIPANLRCCLGRRMGLVRPNPAKLDYKYFLYQYLSPDYQSFLNTRTIQGSTVDRLALKEFPSFPLKLPPLSEQKSIVSILGTLDDKIENNQQMNQTLEEMARAIFKSWFIDFDPVHAKAACNAPAHMDAETAALFPSSFGDDGLPAGWQMKSLGDISDLSWGDTNTTKNSYVEEGFDAYSASGKDGKLSHFDFDRLGIVLSAIGANCGKTWLARGKWSCIKNTIRFWSLNELAPTIYLFHATGRTNFWPLRGSAQPFISQGDARSRSVLIASNGEATHFENFVDKFYKKISDNEDENQTLAELRDTLLPKLMSGEIRVKDAEREVEAAV